MMTHQPEEMKHLLKYGTPSDSLIKFSEIPVNLLGKKSILPVSLNTAKGQKLVYSAAVRINKWLKAIPSQAYSHFMHITDNLQVRRADTRNNYLMVAEAICHRAASEFKPEVIFAFDSINAWIAAKYNKELGYQTLRRALETLQEQGFIEVTEWGVKNNRHRATKIKVPMERNYILTYTSKVDDWLLFNDHALTKVYSRENATRLNVLEAAIHAYAEKVLDDEQWVTEWRKSGKTFPVKVNHDTIVDVEDVPLTLEEIMEILLGDKLLIGN